MMEVEQIWCVSVEEGFVEGKRDGLVMAIGKCSALPRHKRWWCIVCEYARKRITVNLSVVPPFLRLPLHFV